MWFIKLALTRTLISSHHSFLTRITMSSEKPLLVVLGATGTQGGSVLSYFLSLVPPPYALRGITRDPSSAKSVSLASLGVEMVAGHFDDPSSLDAAFKGASAIFSVTDFWQSFANPSLRDKASASSQSIGVICRENEAQQNRNIIDAAAKVTTLERLVFSSLPSPNKLSAGKYAHVYHFDGKGMAEDYGRSAHPKLWEKTNVLYAGYYLENYFGATGHLFRPRMVRQVHDFNLPIQVRLDLLANEFLEQGRRHSHSVGRRTSGHHASAYVFCRHGYWYPRTGIASCCAR